MGRYFGTDGFRGEAGIDLTADHAYKVGRFLGWYYNALRERNGNNEPARIVIGKDTRRSSYMFEYSLVAGLTASGADAYLLHVTTTPSVAYIARVDDFDCGIMISASHNADAVLTQAAETASAKPVSDDAVPPTKRMQNLERKSEKAHERLDAAREKLPTHKVLKKERVFDEETGKGKTRLHFEDELKKPKGKGKLQFEADKTVRKVGDTLASGIHGKIHEVEQENTALRRRIRRRSPLRLRSAFQSSSGKERQQAL